MKSLKKFFLTMAVAMVFSTSAFAASGFEFILNVPLGASIGIPTKSLKEQYETDATIDAGVTAQLGYMFQVADGFGVSVLGELGYAYSSYSLLAKNFKDFPNGDYYNRFSFHSFQIGLLPKFNIGLGGIHGLAIGIGGGVKIPIEGEFYNGKSEETTTFRGGNLKKLKEAGFDPLVIGYIKGTFDYSIFFTDNLAFNIGLYLGGDFIAKKPSENAKKETCSTINVGVELGLKFGPKA